jgi:hypothetical protein
MPAKPPVKLRPPPAALDPAQTPDDARRVAESFVSGRRLDAQTSTRVLSRADGRELRRMTVYLPVRLAKALAVHCAAHDLDLSEAIAHMVAGALEQSG